MSLIADWKHQKKRALVTENGSLQNIPAEAWRRKRMKTAEKMIRDI